MTITETENSYQRIVEPHIVRELVSACSLELSHPLTRDVDVNSLPLIPSKNGKNLLGIRLKEFVSDHARLFKKP